MKVAIKDFDVDMEVKNKGIEFEVRDTKGKGKLLGDFYVTKANLIWCKGRTRRENGEKVSWDEFIQWMNSKP